MVRGVAGDWWSGVKVYACFYCRPRARVATSLAATGAVGLRALAVRREGLSVFLLPATRPHRDKP